MNQLALKSVILLFAIIAFSECRKDEKTFNAFFYANGSTSDGKLNLYIDEKFQGELPFLAVAPTCEDDSLKKIALNIPLKSGKYKIEAKTMQGVVKTSGKIKISNTKVGVSGRMGGLGVSELSGCTFVFLSE